MKAQQRKVKKQLRLKKVEAYMLNGHTKQTEIAAALGVSQPSIVNDMKIIRERWKIDCMQELDDLRALRVKQFEEIRLEAMNAFRRSKEPTVEISRSKKPCDYCSGRGTRMNRDGAEEDCAACAGVGTVVTERIKHVEHAGNPAHLNQAREATVEAAKLQGVYPEVKRSSRSMTLSEDGSIRIEQTLYDNMEDDDIFELIEFIREKKKKVEQKRTIEVIPERIEEESAA